MDDDESFDRIPVYGEWKQPGRVLDVTGAF